MSGNKYQISQIYIVLVFFCGSPSTNVLDQCHFFGFIFPSLATFLQLPSQERKENHVEESGNVQSDFDKILNGRNISKRLVRAGGTGLPFESSSFRTANQELLMSSKIY